MTQTAEKILLDAMKLDEAERIELAAKLMEASDAAVDDGYVAAWEAELEARIRDSQSGRAKSIPLDRAMRIIRGEIPNEPD